MATPDLKRAFRGVDPTQVDEVFRALAQQNSSLEQSIDERNRTIERDLAAANEELRRATKIGAKIDAETLALEERLDKARRNLDDISGFLYTVRILANGFDLGDLSVARSRVASDRANNTASVAELIED